MFCIKSFIEIHVFEYGSQSTGCLFIFLLSFDEQKHLCLMNVGLSTFFFYDLRNLCLSPGDKDILLCSLFL